jgi:hypothetical protein
MNCDALAQAVVALLPDSIMIRQREYDWHSATFSGQRVVLNLRTTASVQDIATFALTLINHAFSLPHMLVADIAMVGQQDDMLTVEALVLDDD